MFWRESDTQLSVVVNVYEWVMATVARLGEDLGNPV
jgi:hypothetical protein